MLSQQIIEDALAAALSTGGDFSEIFVEDLFKSTLELRNGKPEGILSGRDFGIGIRVFKGLQNSYSYTTDTSREGIMKCAFHASQAFSGTSTIDLIPLKKEIAQILHPISMYPRDVEKKRKIDFLKMASEYAQNYHASIQQVYVRYVDAEQQVLIANSEGKYIEDTRVRSRFVIQSIAAEDNKLQAGFYAPGASKGFEFLEHLDLQHYAHEASRIAVTMLNASPCPSGKFPVIIDNEFGGVLFHEACGHGLEASAVAKNNSVFANRIGEKVASDIVTYIDDGTLPNEWGSINIDDEGEHSRKNILIENGILKGYLIDKLNGRRMDAESTGSSRRESYRFAPTSRMTNTYIAPGKSTREDIISNTENGIYAKYMGGGQVDPATGDYNFAIMEAYLVKDGKLGKPVRGATLIGNGPTTIKHIDMIANNLSHGAGMCGASSGSIPVNVGQPMLRVSEITVGGSEGGN
ncbi:peptidase C69 [Paenibacillus macquariensis subsp. defensor]|nr:peptidase C69 [Paenibacillus macquariensis subsp. defensor]